MYTQMIREVLAKMGRIGTNPHHVEAWMRLERGTLDALSPAQFRHEVSMAVACCDASTPAENEALAESYGCAR